MTERIERCDKCRWWKLDEKLFESEEGDIEVGWCKRMPPTVDFSSSVTNDGIPADAHYGCHPCTFFHDFCGEFTPQDKAFKFVEMSISELNLSVRSRKCMIRLGINTIGDLLRHTSDDLLECKNFGVTCLNEVREKLAQKYGLALQGERPPSWAAN